MKKLWIQLWSLWQKFHQSFHESDKTLDWNYKLQLFMKIKRFNCDQCGKNFARGWNLKVLIQNVHEIDSWNKLWGLWQKFQQSMMMFLFSLNEIWILWYYILLSSSITSWYKSRTFSIWIKVTPSKIVYQSLHVYENIFM